MKLERESVGGSLEQPTNRAWRIAINRFNLLFPHKYNFIACFDEVGMEELHYLAQFVA